MSTTPLAFTQASAQEIDQQIENAKVSIKKLEDTIMGLSASGHEITDATKHLRLTLDSLTELLLMRMHGGRPLSWRSDSPKSGQDAH